jgi:hypothetical protein
MLRVLQQFILTTLFAVFASQASAMFIQPDWFDPTQPGVGTNRYAYSFNDPINNRDANGNMADVGPGDILGGIVVGAIVAIDAQIDRLDDGKVNGSQGLGIANGAKELSIAGAELFVGNSSSGVTVGDNVLSITSGNPGLDGVFGGFDDTKEPKGQAYPGTLGELNGELAGLPGADVKPRPDGGATITLPDETKITTYPGRTSTGKPGWAITKPRSKKESIKGSTEGERTAEAEKDDSDNSDRSQDDERD